MYTCMFIYMYNYSCSLHTVMGRKLGIVFLVKMVEFTCSTCNVSYLSTPSAAWHGVPCC